MREHRDVARITLDEAIERTLRAAPRLGVERCALPDLPGRVLAEDLTFPGDLPPFDYAAMDGYAIAAAAVAGARFVVRGESRAGMPTASVEPDTALTISTGAAIPSALDTVIPWEDVVREGDTITIQRDARRGQHVRLRGEDARNGALAIPLGTRLSARHLALIATIERASASVHRRPRVAVLCTGDELRDPGAPSRPGAIVDSNGPMLAALIAQAGGTSSLARVPDTIEALREAIERALDHDVIVTVGGAAEGKHDHVMPVLESLGAETIFRGVAIKPGKPVALAQISRGDRVVPVLALPGNPGSAFVTFTLLGMSLLRAMQADARPVASRLRMPTARAIKSATDRDVLAYGTLDRDDRGVQVFSPSPPSTSGSVPGLASASAIAIVPTGATLGAGDHVDVIEVERA